MSFLKKPDTYNKITNNKRKYKMKIIEIKMPDFTENLLIMIQMSERKNLKETNPKLYKFFQDNPPQLELEKYKNNNKKTYIIQNNTK